MQNWGAENFMYLIVQIDIVSFVFSGLHIKLDIQDLLFCILSGLVVGEEIRSATKVQALC